MSDIGELLSAAVQVREVTFLYLKSTFSPPPILYLSSSSVIPLSQPLNLPSLHLHAPVPPPSDLSPLRRGELQQINDFIEKEPVVPLGGELTFPGEI